MQNMQILQLKSLKPLKIKKEILDNKIFIYPTDTIYGIGCNALNKEAVECIRKLKKSNNPFSVIVPSKQWIYRYCYAKKNYVEKLPGPFTFIFKMRKSVFPKSVTMGKKTIGVRIPDHIFTKLVQKAGVPFITTSVNESGKDPIKEIKNIPRSIKKKVDFIIDAGVLDNKPSTVIDLTKKIAKIRR